MPADRFVVRDGVRLHLRVHAEPVETLVLPGITTSALEWDDVVPHLPGRVAVLDQRGRGESDAPDAGYAVSELAEDDAAVVRSLGAPLAIVGHSQGARAAIRLAAAHPELARRVVAIEPPLVWAEPPWSIDDAWARDRLRFFAAPEAERERLVRAMQPAFDAARVRRRARMLGRIRADVFRRSLEPDPASDLFADAARVRCPVLLVAGEESRGGIGAAGARRLASTFTHGRLVTLPSGHDVPLDDAPGLGRAVADFFAAS